MVFLDPFIKLIYFISSFNVLFLLNWSLCFFFFSFLSMRLSKSYAHGHRANELTQVDSSYFCCFFFFFFKFHASIFFYQESCSLFLGFSSTWLVWPHNHDHEFWRLTLVFFIYFFYFFNFILQCLFLRLSLRAFFSYFFFTELSQSCFYGQEVSILTLVYSIFPCFLRIIF